ncbi:TrpB-like pyridoxal phosphate-dependent enzyme [Parapedobacter koreensis]|uniref:Tryptophan synthase beta chain n=1 Tax=Parapedobacter koreensis TaxID=332977 RepID=A0A1H7SSP0_9SPHI|nr:TrpB-like pyridoxal phosphate-dependent enzyme [Parapedobacter koreensis]SEL75106.1 tryptophan synthase beta chain [Parapedobacter koreensis]
MEKKILLTERDMPTQWYNIVADMPNKPLPPLHPATKLPVGPDDLAPLFPMELIKQEVAAEQYIDIPEEVQQAYRIWRPTPLIRATNLEKALGTTCKIYYKYEGTSPSGSHKPNTAIPQAYYNKQEGVKRIITETGAGQWGTALSFACSQFGIDCEVYMVRISFDQKPYRKILMNTFGATVYSSPTNQTQAGRNALAANANTPGSLGLAISEAIEVAISDEQTKYALGSVLNHVLLHQTVIGQEAKKQLEYTGDYPDIVIAPLGGGSNFAGLSFPFLKDKIAGQPVRCIAVEPASCPKLTKGKFMYDFGDTQGYTPLLPMYTLGHTFTPAAIHAGGLRYHGASVLCSQLLKDGLIEAQAIQQLECFEAGVLFAKAEGIVPAPEANHGIAQVVREVNKAKEEGVAKTILFNLCGHGFVDMAAYQDYFDGKLQNHSFTDEELTAEISKLEALQP